MGRRAGNRIAKETAPIPNPTTTSLGKCTAAPTLPIARRTASRKETAPSHRLAANSAPVRAPARANWSEYRLESEGCGNNAWTDRTRKGRGRKYR